MKKEIIRIDPYTGEEFIALRINQRFSESANRVKFHNYSANVLRKETAHINYPINKTHKLLRKLMENKSEVEYSYDYLNGYGINFKIFNHVTKINGITHPSIYEFTFIIDKKNTKIKIIKNGRF
jgi:hypothetical protein